MTIRYSLDADGLFFPLTQGRRQSLPYSQLIGNEIWVKEVRDSLEALIDAARDEFTGEIDVPWRLDDEFELENFVAEHVLQRSRRPK